MQKNRIGALLAVPAIAGATLLGGAGIANAEVTDGNPLSFDAQPVDGNACAVEFTIENKTNSEHYQIDYEINGEFMNEEGEWPRTDDEVQGAEDVQTRWGPTSNVGEGVTPGAGPLTDDYPTGIATQTVDLNDLDDRPASNADGSYDIAYRLVWGPESDHHVWEHETITLNDCPLGEVSGPTGSSAIDNFIADLDVENLSS